MKNVAMGIHGGVKNNMKNVYWGEVWAKDYFDVTCKDANVVLDVKSIIDLWCINIMFDWNLVV